MQSWLFREKVSGAKTRQAIDERLPEGVVAIDERGVAGQQPFELFQGVGEVRLGMGRGDRVVERL